VARCDWHGSSGHNGALICHLPLRIGSGAACLTWSDLYAGFSLPQELHCLRQGRAQHLLQGHRAAVAKPQPDDLWRGALNLQQSDEILILGHDNCTCCARFGENLRIIGIPHANVPDCHCLDVPGLLLNPSGERWGQLGIQPDLHPTRTGWSRARAA